MNTKKNPLVSIIMNCHNGEKFLQEGVKSIINQTYKNWELIFLDNISNDNSKKIIKSFDDIRVKYFRTKKFLTLYYARNLAIKKAKGKYICFLDVDDFWTKDKLKKQIFFFLKNINYKILYSNYFVLDEKRKTKTKKIKKKNLSNTNITQKFLSNYDVGILTLMIEKSVFKKYKFNNKYNIIGDFDFMIRASLKLKIGYIQKPLGYYRVHDLNFSKNALLQKNELHDWIKLNKTKLIKLSFSINSLKKEIFKLSIKNYLKYLGV